MSYDNNKYPNRKDIRRPYYKNSKRMDRTCRCNGSCDYCYANRLYSTSKRLFKAEYALKEYNNDTLFSDKTTYSD